MPRSTFPPEITTPWIKDYRRGHSIKQIAKRYKRNIHTVRRYLIIAGEPIRHATFYNKDYSERNHRIAELYARRIRYSAINKRFGLSLSRERINQIGKRFFKRQLERNSMFCANCPAADYEYCWLYFCELDMDSGFILRCDPCRAKESWIGREK